MMPKDLSRLGSDFPFLREILKQMSGPEEWLSFHFSIQTCSLSKAFPFYFEQGSCSFVLGFAFDSHNSLPTHCSKTKESWFYT